MRLCQETILDSLSKSSLQLYQAIASHNSKISTLQYFEAFIQLWILNEQFAVVENPGFWNWTFTLKDINGKVLARIDRDRRGFGFEYDADLYRCWSVCDPIWEPIEELQAVRPPTPSERAVAVALAVSLDNGYFSRHGEDGRDDRSSYYADERITKDYNEP